MDRYLPRRGLAFLVYWVIVFALVFGLAPHLAMRERLTVEACAALLAGGWCALNFWRCRHAHCAISGGGWLALSALCFAAVGLDRSLLGGDEQLVFLGVFVAALLFEAGWYRAHGTNAVTRRANTTTRRAGRKP